MSIPKISVIVPVYKVEAYLRQCIDSILGQTYHNLEIILVDDGSPDSCGTICDAYAMQDSRIKVIHKENGGLSDARNAGLALCTGDYIAFVDSDDYLEPTMYEGMMDLMLQCDLDIVYCTVREVINGKKAKVRYAYYPHKAVHDAKEIQVRVLKDEMAAAVWYRLCSRECFDGVRFPVGRTYEDIAVAFLPLENAKKPVGFIDQPFYNYRINDSGIAHHRKPLTRYHMFLSYRDCYEFALTHAPNAADAARANTARFAMGTYLDYHCNKWGKLAPYQTEVEAFLLDNQVALLKDRTMPKSERYSLRLYYTSQAAFILFYRLYIKLRRES